MNTLNDDALDAEIEGMQTLEDTLAEQDHTMRTSAGLTPEDYDNADAEAAAAAQAAEQAQLDAEALAAEQAALVAAQTPAEPVTPPAAEPATRKEYMIPKSRLDEESRARQAAEARAQDLENRLALAANPVAGVVLPPTDPEQMKLYHDAILDGKHEEAAHIMHAIRTQEANALLRQAREEAVQQTRHEQQMQRLGQTIDSLTAEFTFLDPDHGDYDASVTSHILDQHQFYMQKGYPAEESMLKAAAAAISLLRPEALFSAPAPAAEVPAAPNLVATQRTQTQIQRSQLVTGQPTAAPQKTPDTSAKTLDFATMTDEEFNALPESTIRAARGDFAFGR